MKTSAFLMIVMVFATTIISCKTAQKPVGDSSMTSLDWAGTYQGVLPCADCEGIQTQLVLNSDLSYLLETRYKGKDDKVFQTKGNFVWDKTGSKITLKNGEKQMYQVGENKLFHLDKNGNRITGDLAGNYIMEKENIEITDKYWKLVRLNGKPVEQTKREAFIAFDAESKMVSGNSSCNSFNGSFELINTNGIKFGAFAMTKMACMDSNLESEFMQAIGKTTNYSITEKELLFQDEYEKTLAKFEADFFR